jgi:hypothetical protein
VWGLTALDGPFQVTLRPGTVLSAADRAYFDSFGPGDVVTRTGEASGV